MAIGNFDGVHRGHYVLLQQLRIVASRLGMLPTVLTFNPHPRQFFARKSDLATNIPITITPFRDKMEAMAVAGVEQVCFAKFDATMAALMPSEFIEKVLIEGLNARLIIVGEKFRFGKGRTGTTDLLVEIGKQQHFEVMVIPTVTDDGMDRISSSGIRQALVSGRFDKVTKMLGRPYRLSGHVVCGNRLGRKLGFPTANLSMRHVKSILTGVFITRVYGLSGKPFPAVSMIGNRPTVMKNGSTVLETHLLGFSGDIYGTLIKVEFLEKLRDNQKFSSLDALKTAVRQDIEKAERYFNAKTNMDIG